MTQTSLKNYLIWGTLSFVIVWLNRQHFFFWDTVQLTSMHAHWFYDHHFSTFFLPEKYDSGHPPFWGLYHAGLWAIFGKSLITSHLGMWPFIFGSLVYFGKLGTLITQSPKTEVLFGLFILADPVFLTQATLVSPDIALVCFFLMAFYGSFRKKKGINWPLIVGAIGLSMVSLRGMMTLAGIGFFILLQEGWRNGLRKMLNFLPGIVVGVGFLVIHSFRNQWIGYHESSPWAASFQLVGLKGLFKNLAVLIWRLLDVGRAFIWLLMAAIWYQTRQKFPIQKFWRKLFLALSIFLLPTFILYRGLNGMRYLMPILLVIDLLFVYFIFLLRKQGSDRWIMVYMVAFLTFSMGNTWTYPPNISVSWDTTLRHIPYYGLRKKMMTFIQEKEIPITQIATSFPNTAELEIIDLNGIPHRMLAMDDPKAEFYLVSNLFNDIKRSRPNIALDQKLIQRFENKGIWIGLYRR